MPGKGFETDGFALARPEEQNPDTSVSETDTWGGILTPAAQTKRGPPVKNAGGGIRTLGPLREKVLSLPPFARERPSVRSIAPLPGNGTLTSSPFGLAWLGNPG